MLTKSKSTGIVSKHLRELASWCVEPVNAQSLRDETVVNIQKYAAGERPRAGGMAACLEQRAIWFSQMGLNKLVHGRDDGWEDIERARQYNFLAIRILARAYDLDARTPKQWRIAVDHVALAFAHALATDDVLTAAWLEKRLVGARKDGVFGDKATWTAFSFANFIIALADQVVCANTASASSFPMPSVYPTLLKTLRGADSAFRDAFVAAADHHVIDSVEGAGFQAYVKTPYHLLPVELVAALVLRRRVGAVIPKIEHPLLALEFYPIDGTPLPRPKIRDDLLEQVFEVASGDLPDL